MAATSIEINTKDFHNYNYTYPVPQQDLAQVSTNQSYYRLFGTGVIQTLSESGASINTNPIGFLYVPLLADNSTCANSSLAYVPSNVTRLYDLPVGYTANFIAVAPWLDPDCVQAYFLQARADQVGGMIVFLPDQGNSTPPVVKDEAWNLNDGGRWASLNDFPVYAVSTDVGMDVVQGMSQYSGNMSTVPYGLSLEQQYNPHDYIRLYATIDLAGTGGLPSLWIFLVVILAILVAIVGTISFVLHFLQRKRRRSLRRRIANGDVDLEALGIKKLLVPASMLEKMPLYPYEKTGLVTTDPNRHDSPIINSASDTSMTPAEDLVETQTGQSPEKGKPTPVAKTAKPLSQFDQPTCPICLEDFVPGESQVRQLPCQHIFHPECVDIFLVQISSLCPLCKKSALPKSYCPMEITNAMVRRERLLRRANQRAPVLGGAQNVNDAISRRRMITIRLRGDTGAIEMRRQRPDARQQSTPRVPPTAAASGRRRTISHTPQVSPPPAEGEARRQWARRRAEAMLGPEVTQDTQDSPNTSRWRKTVRKIFPTAR